jgi:hypothetical protein
MFDSFLFTKHLEDDEHVRLIVHKHWLLGIRYLVWPTISFLLAWTVLAFRHTTPAALLCLIWGTGSLVWWLRNFLDYYLDAWIITDHGIIDLEWLGWFHRQSARILYSDIQGVSYEINGIFGTLMRYGTVAVEKISTGASVSLSHVSQPRRVESEILKSMEAYLHTKNMKNAKHIESLLSEFVAEHIQEEGMRPKKEPPAPPKKKKLFSSNRV